MTTRVTQLAYAEYQRVTQLADAAERLDAAFECIAQLRAALLELAQAADAALQPNDDPQAMARLRMAIDAAWLNARH